MRKVLIQGLCEGLAGHLMGISSDFRQNKHVMH
jgi:hypothetical protein